MNKPLLFCKDSIKKGERQNFDRWNSTGVVPISDTHTFEMGISVKHTQHIETKEMVTSTKSVKAKYT